MSIVRARFSLPAAVAMLAACSSTPSEPPMDPIGELDYYRDAKPIIDAKCTACHQEGRIAPFALTTWEEVAPMIERIGWAVAERTMPPWPVDNDCRSYEGDRSLTDAQRGTLLAWIEKGAKPGDPSETGAALPPPSSGLSRIDLQLEIPVPYTPAIRPDENRCFLVDWPETSTKFVTGIRADPGEPSIVHHVIVFVAPPNELADYQAIDAEDATPGWPCYGGTGLNRRSNWLGSWVPGSEGAAYPDGTGLRVEPGSKLVVQIHYNTTGADPLADQTSIGLRVEDQVEVEAAIVPFANPGWPLRQEMNIPAGDPDVTHRFEIDVTPLMRQFSGGIIEPGAFRIHLGALHMHTRGTRALLEVVRSSGEHTCAVEIPRWDFHWQSSYRFVEAVEVSPGDKLAVECHFDNSRGERDRNWGESTDEEMCLATVYITP